MCFFLFIRKVALKNINIYIYKCIYIYNNNMVGMRVYRYDNNNHFCRTKIKEIVDTLYLSIHNI